MAQYQDGQNINRNNFSRFSTYDAAVPYRIEVLLVPNGVIIPTAHNHVKIHLNARSVNNFVPIATPCLLRVSSLSISSRKCSHMPILMINSFVVCTKMVPTSLQNSTNHAILWPTTVMIHIPIAKITFNNDYEISSPCRILIST